MYFSFNESCYLSSILIQRVYFLSLLSSQAATLGTATKNNACPVVVPTRHYLFFSFYDMVAVVVVVVVMRVVTVVLVL
jgi:hypothetical protein